MSEKSQTIKAEFHCHTICSLDSSNQIPRLLETARKQGIGKLAITDHNSIYCARMAREIEPDMVIVGEEVLTDRGEIIGYFLEEELPRRIPYMRAIELFKKQGAFISIPHPFDIRRHGWHKEELLKLLPHVDALEVFNARCLSQKVNDQALAFAGEHNIPMLAGSDAHSIVEVGLATVELPDFNNADELREALKSARINARMLSVWDHFKASTQVALGRLFRGNH